MPQTVLTPTPRSVRTASRRGRHRAAPRHARVCGLALSTPPASYSQEEVLGLLGLEDDPFATGVFARSGVTTRHLEASEQTLRTTLQARTQATEHALFRLAVEAIDGLGIDPAEIGLVVTGTSYSLGGPTLAHRILDHYGLDPATDKYHLVGVGCASAVPLFRLATTCMRARPDRRALVVASEIASGILTAARPGDPKVKAVGAALFGDGCGAAVLAPGDEHTAGPTILATATHQLPGTLDHVRLATTADEARPEMSRELPALAEGAARPVVDAFLESRGLRPADIDHWLIHPGGRAIVEGLQRALSLSDDQVAPSVSVLSRFGNVGTASALFVLATAIADRRPDDGELGLMITVGPGVTVGLMLLGWGDQPDPDDRR